MNLKGPRNGWEKKINGWNHTFQMAAPFIRPNGNGVDVGAREGGFAREMENYFDHIYCYDFRPDHKRRLEENVNDVNKFTYTVVGIGEKNEDTFTSSTRVGKIKNRGHVSVKIRTLDSYNLKNVTFIKYDIEGYELRAIKGSEQTIKKYNPVIVVEQNKGDLDSVNLLKSWGYELQGIDKVFNQDYLMVKNVL